MNPFTLFYGKVVITEKCITINIIIWIIIIKAKY